jgi:hypothetical protein
MTIGATLLGELPALPLHTAGKYVAAAYIVLFAMVLVYLAIMGIRMSRTERQLGELLEQLDEHPEGRGRQGGEHPDGRPSQGTGVRESPQP